MSAIVINYNYYIKVLISGVEWQSNVPKNVCWSNNPTYLLSTHAYKVITINNYN